MVLHLLDSYTKCIKLLSLRSKVQDKMQEVYGTLGHVYIKFKYTRQIASTLTTTVFDDNSFPIFAKLIQHLRRVKKASRQDKYHDKVCLSNFAFESPFKIPLGKNGDFQGVPVCPEIYVLPVNSE